MDGPSDPKSADLVTREQLWKNWQKSREELKRRIAKHGTKDIKSIQVWARPRSVKMRGIRGSDSDIEYRVDRFYAHVDM